ncbi:MAG: hypothetical protein LBD46_00425 [Endomicrobium sp.]|nr:hypothetical protein [Endomicrobium sp.]
MFDVTELDDVTLVTSRYEYLRDPYNIIASFFKSVFNETDDTFYRPILVISWIIDTIVGGGKIWVYHLSNVFYHFVAVCMLFNLLKNLNFSRNRSLVFSSFFAIIPLLNQAVSWIPGRNDSILAIFVFGSFMFMVKYKKSGNLKHVFFTSLLFMVSLFTKETALASFVVFPAYMLLDIKEKDFLKKTFILVFSMLVCCLIWYLMKNSFTSTKEISIFHIISYIKAATFKFFPATLQYVSKIFFPVNLKVMPLLSVFDTVLGFLISVFIAALIYISKKVNTSNILFGILWFVMFLVLPYFQNSYFILEHRVYIALVGLIIILNEIKLNGKVQVILPYFMFLYFIFFISVSFTNNIKFANKLVFACAAVTETPDNVKTAFLYGRRFLDNGTFQTGAYFMKKNYEKMPMKFKQKEPSNAAFIGIFAWQRGDIKEAKKYLTIAAEKNTLIHQTYGALANIFMNERRYEEALINIKKAFKLQHENSEYFRYLKYCFDKINGK